MSTPLQQYQFGDIIKIPSLKNKTATVLRKISSKNSEATVPSYEVHMRGFPTTMTFSANELSPPLFPKLEIKESPFHGRGCFAKTDIQVGEIIFREAQLLPFVSESDVDEKTFDVDEKLPSKADQTFMSRLTGGRLHSKKLSEFDDENVEKKKNDTNDDSTPTPILTASEFKQVLRFNQFLVAGVCFISSHANHSCLPNAAFEPEEEGFDPDVEMDRGLIFYAIRPIRAGEEILVSYATLKNRSPAYFQKFGFDCSCGLCQLGKKENGDDDDEDKRGNRETKKKLLDEKVSKLFQLKENSMLLPQNRANAEKIAEEAIAICDELLAEFDLQHVLRVRTSILGEMFQLLAQVDYFAFKNAKANKNSNSNNHNSNWFDRAKKWATRFLTEYAKPGASRGAPNQRFVRIYQVHAAFLKQPDDFGEMIENQIFSQIMAGNYE